MNPHTSPMPTPSDDNPAGNIFQQLDAVSDEPRGGGNDDRQSGDTTPDDDTQGTPGEAPEATEPEGGEPEGGGREAEAFPEAGGEGEGEPSSQDRQTKSPAQATPPGIGLFQNQEFVQTQRAREKLDKLKGETAFLEQFVEWANEHPEGGRCVIQGREIGEFTSDQIGRALETVKRRLTVVEIDRRLAEEQLEQSQGRAMQLVLQAARAIAPGVFVNEHPQQRIAQAIVSSIPAHVRQVIENDPVANIVLALAVRGLESINQKQAQGQRPTPTRSVTQTGASRVDAEVNSRRPKQDVVKRLIEGRGSVTELAAILR